MGIGRQDREFWKYVGEKDYICLSEAWVEEKGWSRIERNLPTTHRWICEAAKRNKKKGRAKGGIIVGVRKDWGMIGTELMISKEEGIIAIRVRKKESGSDLVVIGVYNNEEWGRMREKIKEIAEENKEECIIMGGDFNARIGGGEEDEIGWREGRGRESKDKVINKRGRQLLELVGEIGGNILNGTTKGDREGEFTYVSERGCSVIDFVAVNDKCQESVISFKVESRVDSDHMPLVVEIEEEEEERRGKQKEEPEWKEEGRWRICWEKEAAEAYRNKTDGEWIRREEDSIEEKWGRLKEMVQEAWVKREVKIKKRKIGYKDWWDRSCTRKKRMVHRNYIGWKKGKIGRDIYVKAKREWRNLQEEKRRKKREEEERDLRGIKNEAEAWKYINKRRGKREWIQNKIRKKDWEKHFMELLEGRKEEEESTGGKEHNRKERQEGNNREEEERLEDEKIGRAVLRMKKKKAAGYDGIPMEAWIYGGTAVREGLREVIRQAWKEDIIPRDWRMSVIVPIFKKGDQDRAENYRGISLLCTAYKIYAEILRGRLEKEVERIKVLPESQCGFRKGRGTMDSIFILNHLIQREGMKEEKRIFATFIDLKAAFDNVDKEKLWELMEEKGLKKRLVERLRRIYEDTRSTVRTEEGMTENFSTRKGVKQGCVLSPLLFSVYVADMDNKMRKRGIGGISLGKERVWSLAYADDMVLVAKNREAMIDMLSTLGRFLRERNLTLNTEKTKVMIFNKGRKDKTEEWKWRGAKLEEVQVFKYLGYMFNRKGNYKDQMEELKRKGRIAANKVWGLGERICRDDFERRWGLFGYLVRSVMEYGVELWGWQERKELEKIMLDYIRWIFKLDFCTPRYIITRELGIEKLKIGWGLRARKFEEKIGEMEEERWVKICWREKQREGWKDLYGIEREKYYNRNGWGIIAIDGMAREERNMKEELRARERDVQRQLEDQRAEEARYNKVYKNVRVVGKTPEYLERDRLRRIEKGEGTRALIRVRCGNMEEDNKYWMGEEDRKCVFCEVGKDNWEHFIGSCEVTKGWFEELGGNTEARYNRIWDDKLDRVKDKVLRKFWLEKEEARKERRKAKLIERGE